MPKVSVIVPVYNVEKYLKKCLSSVVIQTLKDIEIICVDDGSTDNSLEILKECAAKDNRFIILEQANQGAGAARNKGLKIAQGEFIAFMDGDDFYPNNNVLEKLYTLAIEKDVKICGGSLAKLKANEIYLYPSEMEREYAFETDGYIDYKDYQFDYGFTRFIYNNKFLQENDICFPNYKKLEDPPFFIKAMSLAKMCYAIKEATYVYRVSYKTIECTERCTVDIFKGIEACLNLCIKNNYEKLYCNIFKRINMLNLYTKAVIDFIGSKEVRNQVYETFSGINYDLLEKNNCNTSLHKFYKAIMDSFNYNYPISVIISIYNVEKYLRECLDSVVNQTLKDIEIICINDGSTDGSAQILEEYVQKDNRIKLITQKNQGLACSRNNALKIATGEYVLCVDSDDYIRQDTLEKLYQKAKENDLDMLSFGGTNFDNETREILGNSYYEFRYLPEDFSTDCFNYNDCTNFITKMAVSSCLTIYKHSFIKDYNIEFPPHLCFEDNVFFCKALMNAQKCGILKDTLYFRRIHSQSITQNWAKNHLDFVKIAGMVLDYLQSIKIDKKIYSQYQKAYSNTVVNNYNKYDEIYKRQYYKSIKEFCKIYNPEFLKKIKRPENIFERIFSIKNEGVSKVITIFGIKFKFKSKKLIKRQEEKKKNKKINKILKSLEAQKEYIDILAQKVDLGRENLTAQQNVIAELNTTINLLRKTKKEQTEILLTRLNIPKLSVIVPIYNADKYLETFLNNLINQTLKEIEIICVNDASTDNSLAILNKFASIDKRIKIISHKTNLGSGAARNTGLEAAQGLCLSFLDADDCFQNNILEKLYMALSENDTDLAICSYNYINVADNAEVILKQIKNDGFYILNNKIRADINVELWNKLFKRVIVDKYNIKFPNTRLGDDTSFTRQYLMMSESAIGINEALYDYRRNNEGIMSELNKSGEYVFESLAAQIYTLEFIKSLSTEKQKECMEFYTDTISNYIKFFLKYVSESRRDELLTKVNDDILNKIPENFSAKISLF